MANRFEDLIAWRLAHQLQEAVLAFTAKPSASRDFRFCEQIRDSARSAPANIAEGFGRYYPREFTRFLRIAAGSLQETLNHLIEAKDRTYLSEDEHLTLKRLALRAIKAVAGLIRYLEGPAATPFKRPRR